LRQIVQRLCTPTPERTSTKPNSCGLERTKHRADHQGVFFHHGHAVVAETIKTTLCTPTLTHSSLHMDAQIPLDMDESEQRSSPLAGPGTTRANRRLQLRKNGFRGRVLPNRNITPKRRISDAWSSPAQQDDTPTSDLPQQPESNKAYLSARGRSSSILQEVSNSSLRRKDKNKNKHDSVLSVFADENGDDKPWNFESSPAWYHKTIPPL
jgi:hypothetical protein